VLRMGRVPASDFLNTMAADGRLVPSLLDAIADAVATYHQAIPPLPDAEADMRWMARGNVEAALEAGLPAKEVEAWGAAIDATLSGLLPWLKRRVKDGFVRRAHGDLHLGNLCLWRGKPVPFDALEFDEALATIDLGYDLAFLLMDLEHRVGRAAANRVLNRYIARTGDADLVRGLPAFLSLRALVRAHVTARSGQPDAAQSYLTAAIEYLRPACPVVLAVGGLPGTGKSTLARALAPGIGRSPGALIVRSDEIRKRLMGVAPEDRLPPSAYTPDVSRTVFEILAETVLVAANAGQAVVADATFMDPAHRTMVEQAAHRAGVPFRGFWLQAPLAQLEQRVSARTGDASDATVAVLHAAAPNDPGPLDWTPIDASDATNALARVRISLPRKTKMC
jgi:predicted kinase